MRHMENVLHVLKFDFRWVWAQGDNVIAISIWLQICVRGSFCKVFYWKFRFSEEHNLFFNIWEFYFFKYFFGIIQLLEHILLKYGSMRNFESSVFCWNMILFYSIFCFCKFWNFHNCLCVLQASKIINSFYFRTEFFNTCISQNV